MLNLVFIGIFTKRTPFTITRHKKVEKTRKNLELILSIFQLFNLGKYTGFSKMDKKKCPKMSMFSYILGLSFIPHIASAGP